MNRRFKILLVTMSSCLVLFLLLGTLLGGSAAPEDGYRHFAVYTEVLQRIKSEYVEEPDMKDVTLGALNGLLESIDPYASYLSADQFKQYQKYLKVKEDEEAGTGLLLSRRFGYVGVVDSIPGSPGAKAGLSTGDMLETINGVSTRDMPLAYADMLLHGTPGSKVELTAMRVRRSAEAQAITLVRDRIHYPPVSAKILQADIGYVQLQSLEAGKTKEVAYKINGLQKEGARRFILDLRRSAYGDPEEGVALAGLFLKDGLITYLQGQRVPRKNFEASSAGAFSAAPLVVITNRGTAGGAEIAAAALLDSKRAEVVGERTYGNAGVRRPVTLDDGSAIILSVAKYYSPSGKAIQDTGVTPSVVVIDTETGFESEEEESPEAPAQAEPQRKPEDDPLLKKAIEVLTKGPGKGPDQVAAGQPSDRQEAPPPFHAPRPQ